MSNFLQQERKRLGLGQSQVSEFVGITVPTLSNYEKGKRQPDLDVLMKMRELGYDMKYVMTGERDSNHLTAEEAFLLEKFRQADQNKRNSALAVLMFDEESIQRSVSNSIGNISNSTVGDIKQGN